MKKQHFIFILILYVVAVFYLTATTPISSHEATHYYSIHDIVSLLMHWGEKITGGFLGIRLFFILFGFLSIAFFYALSRRYFKERRDAYIATTLFMLLPGVLTATSLANIAIIVLPLVLFFVLMYERQSFWSLPFVMLALFFIHEASIIFFVALLAYGIVHKDKKLSILSSAFLIAFVYLSKGIEIGGRPSGHFLEIFGLYATVFSPLLFFYFFYAMYRILLREKKTLLWYISFTALVFSLLLSIRQRVYITDFAPYVTISVILMLDVFNHSVRVRLRMFQKSYKRAFYLVVALLVVSVFMIVFHQVLFYLMKDPSQHFAYRIYKPYILAKELKKKGISCYNGKHGREESQLRYYHINRCQNHHTLY